MQPISLGVGEKMAERCLGGEKRCGGGDTIGAASPMVLDAGNSSSEKSAVLRTTERHI